MTRKIKKLRLDLPRIIRGSGTLDICHLQKKGEEFVSTLSYCLEQAVILSPEPDVAQLEKHFAVCVGPESLAEFIEALVNTPFWTAKRSHDGHLPEACHQLAASIDAYVGFKAEPAYHSRRHFKEVCLALSVLLQSGQSLAAVDSEVAAWSVDDFNCWILLLAAIAHDFGHEGRPNRTHGELEEKACQLAEDYLQAVMILPNGAMEKVQRLVRATEPSLYMELVKMADNAGKHIDTEDVMKVLLVEADLLASMLPNYGVVLGKLLAEEFRPQLPDLADLIGSVEGRQAFLRVHPSISPNLHRLGFND